MPTTTIIILDDFAPMTRREAYNIGWNNVYCRNGHAFPPLSGELLEAFEEGMTQGKKDKENDSGLLTFSTGD